jgi:predicted MFS family arabinose efflux permease
MRETGDRKKRNALQLILLLGVVSALGDITYESARGVSGPFFLSLGAGAAVIGIVSGFGEFLGYALRVVTGYWADRRRSYWSATFIGYGLLLAVPLLALASRWEIAALLLGIERIGKAIRSPSRDTILSYATRQTGRGWGFALHEFLDQTGAVIGPLLFTVVFAATGSYQDGFLVLLIPALLAMVALFLAWMRVPTPEALETEARPSTGEARPKLPRTYWVYALFAFLSVTGFASFPVITYHWTVNGIVSPVQIPILYAVAMGVDAVVALVAGKAYDKVGLKTLVVIPLLTLPIPFLAFFLGYIGVVVSVVLWGAVMGFHETTMRAAIADLTTTRHRASAYGIFNAIYGAGCFLGSAALGLLYARSISVAVSLIVAIEVLALLVFLFFAKSMVLAGSKGGR